VGGRNIKPEFASGGVVPGINMGFDSVTALLTPGEIVLNAMQQRNVAAMAGVPNVFQIAGVPGAGQVPVPTMASEQSFNLGGIVRPRAANPSFSASASSGGGSSAPIALNLSIESMVSIDEEQAGRVFVRGAKTADGRNVTVNIVKTARKFGDI
jgi:hypothetical protein